MASVAVTSVTPVTKGKCRAHHGPPGRDIRRDTGGDHYRGGQCHACHAGLSFSNRKDRVMSVTRPEAVEILQGGQTYAWVRSEPYRRLDGSKTVLHVYRSPSARCGRPSEVKIGKAVPQAMNRRCLSHRRPGSKA